jgi:putative ABC transport system permease protein
VARFNPAWRKAPLLLFRFRQLAIAVMVGAAILGLATASRPAFLASSGRAALDQQMDIVTRWGAGLRLTRHGQLARSERIYGFPGDGRRTTRVPIERMVDEVSTRLAKAVRGIDNLGAPTLMRVASDSLLDGGSGTAQGRLLTRTDAFDNVEVLSGGDTDGVWITDVSARQLNVEVGDSITIAVGSRSTTAEVSTIYRHLASDRLRPYWGPARELIYKEQPSDDTFPSPLILASESLFNTLVADLHDTGRIQWNYPVRATDLSIDDARLLADDLSTLIQDKLTNYSSPIVRAGRIPYGMRGRATAMPSVADAASNRVQSLQGPVDVLSIAAIIVALVVMGAAGFYLVQRRRVEFVYLAGRGITPTSLGLKAAIESAAPAAIGCTLGLLIGIFVSGLIGPGDAIPTESIPNAIRATSIALLGGIVVIGVVAARTTRREEGDEPHGWPAKIAAHLSWEVVVGVVGAVVLWRVVRGHQLVTSEAADGISLEVLLLPAVGILGAAGLAARGLRWLLPRLTRGARRWSPPRYLAARRLAGSSKAAIALVAACTFSLGVLVYSSTLARSTRSTAAAKAQVFAGSDLSTVLPPSPPRVDLPMPSSYVIEVARLTLEPGDRVVRSLGVDTETFEDVAFWDSSFSSESLESLLRALESKPDEGVSAIAVGSAFPDDIALHGGDEAIPVNIVGRADVFPGQVGHLPMLVMADEQLESVLPLLGGAPAGRIDELWARGDPDEIERVLNERGVLRFTTATAALALESPSVQSLMWSLGLLQALGVAAGLISIAGLVLYLQAREKTTTVVRALTRRMRLSRRGYLKMLLIETSGLLMTSFVLGAGLGLVVSAMLMDNFDLNPDLPPSQLFRIPALLIVAAGIILGMVAVLSAKRIQRASDSANVAEVMRVT